MKQLAYNTKMPRGHVHLDMPYGSYVSNSNVFATVDIYATKQDVSENLELIQFGLRGCKVLHVELSAYSLEEGV